MCVLSAVHRAGCDPGSVPGFHLEAPAQETHLGSGHASATLGSSVATSVWCVGLETFGKGLCFVGFHHSGKCSAQMRPPNSLQGKGAGRWSG